MGIIKYRNQSERLFQSVPRAEEPNPLPNGSAFKWNNYGVTWTHVDRNSGWKWNNLGGDWLDANGTPQGTAPFTAKNLNAVSGSNASAAYSADITDLVNATISLETWFALHLKTVGGVRTFAGARHTAAPVVSVVYEDGTTDTLPCVYSAALSSTSVYSFSTSTTHQLPCVLEFPKPTQRVTSATLLFTITAHFSGTSTLNINLVNPPINTNPAEEGVSSSWGALDDGLELEDSILGTHRYVDGSSRDEFISSSGLNIYAERDFDPAIWDNGPTDTTKLPHRDLGKFIAAGDQFQLVDSSYIGEGFEPLAPGLGAMKVSMPKSPLATTGAIEGSSGTTGSIAKIYLPEEKFGRMDRLFIRYYIRFGTPLDNTFSKKYAVYNTAGATPVWTDMGGKTGITASHDTTYGGYSGSSGGGYGWQMRLAWSDLLQDVGEPNGGGTSMGVHTYDFGTNNPVGHRYMDGSKPDSFGDIGGLAGVFYPNQWYCIEQELKLNTASPTWLADGYVKTWVDGRLVLDMQNMVMRTLPLVNKTYNPLYMRPCRELGIRDLNFNWFHGGKTLNPIDRTIFVTGLAWGEEYIGPMVIEEPIPTPAEDVDTLLEALSVLEDYARDPVDTQFFTDVWPRYEYLISKIDGRW